MSMSMNECQWSMTMTLFDPLLAFCKSYILSPIRNNARKNAIWVIDDPLPLLLIHEVPFAQPSFRCIFLGIFGRLMVIQVQAVPIRQRHRRNWRNLVRRSNVINWAEEIESTSAWTSEGHQVGNHPTHYRLLSSCELVSVEHA